MNHFTSVLVVAASLATACAASHPVSHGSTSSSSTSSVAPDGGQQTEGERRCVAGDREACRQVALEYEPLCDHGDLHFCVLFGLMFEHGRGVGHDDARAQDLFTRACDGNELRGCAQLAALFSEGRGTTDAQHATAAGERACDGNVLQGCVALGRMYLTAHGVTRDVGRAERYYAQACDHGDPVGCARQGVVLLHDHTPPESARGVQLLQRGCDGGDLVGCLDLAVLVVQGAHGLTPDGARALSLAQRACDGGEMGACRQLGVWYASGQIGARDVGRARELLHRACEGGFDDACGDMNQLPPN